jgi:hypothetical protein
MGLRALTVRCRAQSHCTVHTPPHAAGAVDVTAIVHGLASARTRGDRYEYAR